jgi:uncharacterized protein YecE (DUF72 family)
MSRKASRGEIRVGPAGWSYDDWAGIVYPARKPRGFHEASYLAQFFDTIEINTTFYHAPEARMVGSWVRRVSENPGFRFTAKLWQRFTHDRNANREDEKVFKEGIRPLVEAGRLGALLVQFPWSFKNTRQNREYLSGLLMMFMEYPLVIEVRHSSWNQPEVFAWLAESGVGFCNIDQPVIGRSLAPTARAIPQSGLGYVRLHGRNYEQWFSATETGAERYNYFYSMEELRPWAERIRQIAENADVTFVITNNHFRGQAIANALQLVSLMRAGPVRVPETLLAHYPQLQEIASGEPLPTAAGETGSLFDAPAKEG